MAKKKKWHLKNDDVVKAELEEMLANQIVIKKLGATSFRDVAKRLQAKGFNITHEAVRLVYKKHYGNQEKKEHTK